MAHLLWWNNLTVATILLRLNVIERCISLVYLTNFPCFRQ